MDFHQEQEKKKYRVRFSGWMIFKIVALITLVLLVVISIIAIIVFKILR